MIPIVQSIGMLAMNPIMSNANPRMIISHLLSVAIDGREVATGIRSACVLPGCTGSQPITVTDCCARSVCSG